jgi:HD-GYP domain-containing protein (c-di-GMP phosphodiesterase class II)
MKTHPDRGAEIISHIKYFSRIISPIRYHHEWYDGRGYPHGICGEEIPIFSRIIAVADAFDAMTTDRVYRKSPGLQKAIEELKSCSGTQFDRKVVEAFIKAYENGDIMEVMVLKDY